MHRVFQGVVAAGLLAAVSAPAQDRAGACSELVLHNGTIATMDSRNTMARSVTIRGDRIAAVGTALDVPKHESVLTVVGGKMDYDAGVLGPAAPRP